MNRLLTLAYVASGLFLLTGCDHDVAGAARPTVLSSRKETARPVSARAGEQLAPARPAKPPSIPSRAGSTARTSTQNRESASRNSDRFSSGFTRKTTGVVVRFQPARLPEGLPAWFRERDRDRDGQVGLYEWPQTELGEFARYDRNADGFMTAEEVLGVLRPQAATGTKTSTPATARPPTTSRNVLATQPSPSVSASPAISPAGSGEKDTYPEWAQEFLTNYDRNKDGKIDQEEAKGSFRLRRGWEGYDADNDNALNKTELISYLRRERTPSVSSPASGSAQPK